MPDDPATNKGTEPTVLPEEFEDALTHVTLEGKREQRTIKELRDGYQKKEVSDRRFREGHEAKSSAETSIDVHNDLRQGFTERDSTKIRRAFRNSGLSDEDCDSIFAGQGAAEAAPTGAEANGLASSGVTENSSDEGVAELVEVVDGLQKQIQELQNDKKQTADQRKQAAILREVDGALDNDPELGQRLSELAPEDQQELRELAYKLVAKASKTTPWGPRAIQEGLKLLKARKALWSGSGTRESEDRTPGATPGFGPSGHSAGNLHPTTGTKPVSVYDKGYAGNLLKRLTEKMNRSK